MLCSPCGLIETTEVFFHTYCHDTEVGVPPILFFPELLLYFPSSCLHKSIVRAGTNRNKSPCSSICSHLEDSYAKPSLELSHQAPLCSNSGTKLGNEMLVSLSCSYSQSLQVILLGFCSTSSLLHKLGFVGWVEENFLTINTVFCVRLGIPVILLFFPRLLT